MSRPIPATARGLAVLMAEVRKAEDAARHQGFADCEALVVAMLKALCLKEGEAFLALSNRAQNLPTKEKGPVEQLAYRAQHRAAVLREAALAISLGQHRTDQYDEAEIRAVHAKAGMPSDMQSKGGKARAASLSPARRSEIATKAARTRWHPDEQLDK